MSTRHARPFALAVLALALSAGGCSRTEPSAASSSAVAAASTLLVHQEGETMTSGGGCVTRTNPYANLQCRSDAIYGTFDFPEAARYRFVVRGASSSSSRARAGLYVGGVRAAGLEWPGTAFTDVELTWDVSAPGAKEVRFVMEVDDGTSDTYIDWFELYSEGPIPPPPEPPPPPPESAYASGVYRNLFQEWNPSITDAQVQAKLDEWWASLFASTDDNKRVYYPYGTNTNGALAYIKDVGDNDIRSEGVSYGMMIAVQMNKQAEFNALWNFAKSVMQHQTGPRKGYFAWQVSTSGSIMDQNPASDGEEYFATALFFAGHRWGNGTGIYNYTAEANAILDVMLHKEDMNAGVLEGVTSMFNRTQKQVVFVPYYDSANFTDPSYHLPAFYELWARWAAGWNGQAAADRQFWLDAAATSRAFFPKAAHATTGLSPDYAEFNGAPNNTNSHGDFRFDAWRVAMNWAVDHSWFRQDATEPVLADRLQAFLYGQGITSYGNQFTLAGSPLSTDHSPGLVACTGVASLAATHARRLEFVRELWNLNPPTGQWRYYDGMLSFMSLLHASGHFKIWKPGGSQGPYTLTVAKAGTGSGTVTSTPAGLSCGSTCSASFANGTTVTLTATGANGNVLSGWSGACTGTAPTCTVVMSANQTVTATFTQPVLTTLTVTRDGTGSGMVGSSPAGVDCGTTCTGSFALGTSVTLLAVPAHDSLFTGWSGACSGTAACVVSMTEARSVTATFDRGSIYTLGVTRSGTGTGTVTSSPAGINCGTTCSASYVGGTVVTLTAAASSGSTFGGWTGCTATSGATCTVSMTASLTVTATFSSSGYLLTVNKAGTGTGTVTSTPSGINCGATCSATYTSGTRVTLRRTVASGSTFGGWSGACSGTTTTCIVTMSQARTVTATFNGGTPSYALTVTRSGTGTGTVTSTPAGIDCGSTCSATYASGTAVTLTAVAATGSAFAGWTGACSGTTTTCMVTMSQARSATATFNANPILYTLSVTRSGTGSGTVTSTPAGVSCGTTCSALFGSASVVTLTATPASGSVFSGWSGACSGAAATCTVTMTGAQSVTASFTPGPTDAVLTVTAGGTGSGTVTSSPAGVSCGTTCSAPFAVGTTVTLTATAASPSTFGGWGGACTGTAATCVVTMSAAQSVTATFNPGDPGNTPCANPISFSWNTGNFGTTGAVCYRASQTIYGWNCSNMAGRTVSINGGPASATCGGGALAKHTDGFTYFSVSAGQYPWASISVW